MDTVKWHRLSTMQQLGNIGAEIGRTISWKQNRSYGDYHDPFYRALSYLDLSISDGKNSGPRLKEICRVREALVDWFLETNLYHTTNSQWINYFNSFAIAANQR